LCVCGEHAAVSACAALERPFMPRNIIGILIAIILIIVVLKLLGMF
jgi:hypothetical protein